MPRFGTKSLLVVFAVAALWLSTFSGYRPAQDVRRSILLLLLISSGVMAIHSRGQRRAFWSAFFVVMLLCGGLGLDRPLSRYVPDFAWLQFEPILAQPPLPAPPTVMSVPNANFYPPNPQPVTTYPLVAATPSPVFTPAYQTSGSTMREAIYESIAATWTITLAFIAGFLAAYIYTQLPGSTSASR